MSKHALFGTEHCDRCGKELGTHVMSMFNKDTLCMDCKDKEKLHPDYNKAREAERQAIKNGDYNYMGIGKPADL
jgi:hypothetical protein